MARVAGGGPDPCPPAAVGAMSSAMRVTNRLAVRMNDIGGAGGGIVIQRLGHSCHDIRLDTPARVWSCPCPLSGTVSGAVISAAPAAAPSVDNVNAQVGGAMARDDIRAGRNQAWAMTRLLPGRPAYVIAQGRGIAPSLS